MPLLIAIAVVFAAFALMVVLMPFAIVFRYRAGTRQRQARGWMATLNLVSFAICRGGTERRLPAGRSAGILPAAVVC